MPLTREAREAIEPKKGRGPRLLGFGVSGALPMVSSKGPRVLAEAILYRVFRHHGMIPNEQAWEVATALLEDVLPEFSQPITPMTTEEWIMSMPTGRRSALINALEDYQLNGLTERHRIFKSFVKTELLPWFSQKYCCHLEFSEYVARLIQAPNDVTHIIAGRFIKPVTYRLKKFWGPDNWIFYGSVNPETLDRWLNRNFMTGRRVFWCDYSAFDCTHNKYSWALLEQMYRVLCPEADADFWEVMDIWRSPHGKIKFPGEGLSVEYHAPVMNASGRDDTALANALLNGLVMSISIAAAHHGIPVHAVRREHLATVSGIYNLSVVGDDSLCFGPANIDQMFCDRVAHNVSVFGFSAKIGWSPNPADATYLGMMPYRLPGEWKWGPTLGRRLYKAFWQATPTTHPIAWLRGVCTMYSKCFAFVPILSDMAARTLELIGSGPTNNSLADPHRIWQNRTERTGSYTEETIRCLCDRYERLGAPFTPMEVRHLIDTIRSVPTVPVILDHEVLSVLVAVDDL